MKKRTIRDLLLSADTGLKLRYGTEKPSPFEQAVMRATALDLGSAFQRLIDNPYGYSFNQERQDRIRGRLAEIAQQVQP